MAKISIGKTGLSVEKTGFGALPIQRVTKEEAVRLLRMAYDGGMEYFDTARAYTDSEEKLGEAFKGMRDKVVIATKTMATKVEDFWAQLETSLRLLQTDYIDIYQFHNPRHCPRPGDGTGLYEAMEEAKKQGKIRFIGITNHRPDTAAEAIASGLYETLQYPFNYLCTDVEMQLMKDTVAAGMGFICMKAMSGGLLSSAKASAAWLEQYPVIPIWGVQREEELQEFLGYMEAPPALTPELEELIKADRESLQGNFCRACGYCMPTCPQHIQINTAARMSLLLRRAPTAMNLGEMGQKIMAQAETCIDCGVCKTKCPYGLDTPALLKRNCKDYREVLAGKPILPKNF